MSDLEERARKLAPEIARLVFDSFKDPTDAKAQNVLAALVDGLRTERRLALEEAAQLVEERGYDVGVYRAVDPVITAKTIRALEEKDDG